MADPINIVVTSTDKTAAGFQSVTKGMTGIANSARGTLTKGLKVAGAAFGGLALAGAAGVAGLGAAITKMTLDASQVEGVASTFEQLAASINAEAEPAMQLMREATRGMVADADLMQAGNKFMAMGLADTQEEMGKLSLIATQLGSAMGEGPTESMENFALMLANQSIPRLDSFGISSGQVRERIKELMEETEGLTREQAFMTAVMEQAEVTMAKVGEQGETSAASIARIQASMENTALGVGQKFIPVLKEALKPVADLAEKVGPKLIEWAGSAADWIGTWLPGAIEKATTFIGKLMDGVGPLIGILQQFASAVAGSKMSLDNLPGPLRAIAEVAITVKDFMSDLIVAFGNFFEVLKDYGPLAAIIEVLDNFIPEETISKIWDIVDAVEIFISTVADKVGDLVTWKDVLIAIGIGIASIVLPAVVSLVASIGALVAPVLLVIAAIALLRKAWESNFLGIQDVVANLMQQVGPFIESVVSWFREMIPVAVEKAKMAFQVLGDVWRTAIQPALAALGQAFGELFSALKSAWSEIAPIFADLGKTIGDAFGLGGGEAIKFADVMKVAVQAIIIPIKVLTGVVTVLAKVIGGAASLMGKAWGKHGKTITKVLGFILKGFQKTFGQIFKVVDKVLKAISKIWNKLFGNSQLLDQIYSFGRELVRAFISFLAGVIDEVIAFGKELVRTFDKYLEEAKKVVDRIFNEIRAIIEKVLSQIQAIIEKVWGDIKSYIDRILDQIKSAVESAWNWIKSTIDRVLDQIKAIVKDAWDSIKSTIDSVLDQIKAIVSEAWNSIKSTIETVLSQIKVLVQTAWNEIKSTIETVLSQIKSTVESAWQDIKEAISQKLQEIGSEISSRWNEFLSNISSVLSDIVSEVSSKFQEIYDTVRQKLLDLAEIPGQIAETLKSIGTEIINFIVAGIQAVGDFVSRVVQQITDWFIKVRDNIAASFSTAAQIGEQLVEKIIEGIVQFSRNVRSFITDVINQIKDWMAGVRDDIKSKVAAAGEIGQKLVESIIEGIKSKAESFISWLVGWLPARILEALGRITGSPIPEAYLIGTTIADSIMQGIADSEASIGRMLGNAVQSASAGIELPVSLSGSVGGLGMAGVAGGGSGNVYMGGQTFSPTINSGMDEEEFVYRVQEALRQLT